MSKAQMGLMMCKLSVGVGRYERTVYESNGTGGWLQMTVNTKTFFGYRIRDIANSSAISHHSARSVTAGSTRVPARAGTRMATSATSTRTNGTAINVNGS